MPLAMHPEHLVPLPLLLLLLHTNTVVSNPATHNYPPECVPPPGAFPTTTTYPPNSTTLLPYPDPLLPIDYCCPQVKDCAHKNGFCALNWLIGTVLPGCCDFTVEEICKDYGCSCCIKCSKDKCSKCTETGGNCRVKCRADETRDYFKKCSYKECHCCKKCTENDECIDAKGKCFTNHYDCPAGTAASTGCCGGCYCCKPELQKLLPCERKTGSYCSPTEDCDPGYYPCFGECQATEWENGLEQAVPGYCCSPKIPAVPSVGRMGAFNYYMDKITGDSLKDNQLLDEELLPAEIDDLSPKPLGGNSRGNVEKIEEDQIYDEVEPVEKKEQQYINDNSEVDADIEIQNERYPSPKLGSHIQEDSDNDDRLVIDIPIDLSYQEDSDKDDVAIDSSIDISDQEFISDIKLDQKDNKVEENNNIDEKIKHQRKNHHKNVESKKIPIELSYQEGSDLDADVAIDSSIEISDQEFVSDLEVDRKDNKVEENNRDEKTKHHRRNHNKNVENNN